VKISMEKINEAVLSIDEKYINKYNELFSDNRDYASFVRDLSYELLNKINLSDAVEYNTEQLLHLLMRTRRYTKKRWVDSELKNSSKFLIDITDQATVIYNRDAVAFKLTYKVTTLDELKEDMAKLHKLTDDNLIVWSKDDNSCFVDFEYLKQKKRSQLVSAFESDFNWIVLNYLKKNLDTDIGMSMPIVISDIPVDISGRRKVSLSDMDRVTVLVNNKEVIYYHDIDKYKDAQISTYVDSKYVKKYCLDNAFKRFNALDKKIFSYILSKRKSNFFETRVITVDIIDIVRYIYASNGVKNYNTVRESIEKMKSIEMRYTINNHTGILSSVFIEVIYDDRELGNTSQFGNTATITVSSLIVDQLMEAQTIIIYGEKVEEMSPEEFSLVCVLQSRRMRQYAEKINLIEDILPYSFFQVRFRLSDKRKIRNLSTIKSLFKKLQRMNILIKDFSQVADTFHVEYYPLTEKEIINFDDNGTKPYLIPLEE
jgi:hypothetical protein